MDHAVPKRQLSAKKRRVMYEANGRRVRSVGRETAPERGLAPGMNLFDDQTISSRVERSHFRGRAGLGQLILQLVRTQLSSGIKVRDGWSFSGEVDCCSFRQPPWGTSVTDGVDDDMSQFMPQSCFQDAAPLQHFERL